MSKIEDEYQNVLAEVGGIPVSQVRFIWERACEVQREQDADAIQKLCEHYYQVGQNPNWVEVLKLAQSMRAKQEATCNGGCGKKALWCGDCVSSNQSCTGCAGCPDCKGVTWKGPGD